MIVSKSEPGLGPAFLSARLSLFWVQHHLQKRRILSVWALILPCLCVRTFFFFFFKVFCSQDINHPTIYDLGHPQVTHACIHAKSLQSYPTLCDPVDSSPPGSSVHGILQERILEWVAMPSSRGSSRPRDQTCVSYISCTGKWVSHH